MEDRHLVIAWKSIHPDNATNLWHVKGEITYENGKLVFQIANGSVVRIDPEQLVYIDITKTSEEMDQMTAEIYARHGMKWPPDKH